MEQPDSSVYTFASLEQLGSNTGDLINYWITNKASIVVNIEPMSEPLDDNELLSRYETACDPRLNNQQSLELIFKLNDLMK